MKYARLVKEKNKTVWRQKKPFSERYVNGEKGLLRQVAQKKKRQKSVLNRLWSDNCVRWISGSEKGQRLNQVSRWGAYVWKNNQKKNAQHYSQNDKISLKTWKKKIKIEKLDIGSVIRNTLFSRWRRPSWWVLRKCFTLLGPLFFRPSPTPQLPLSSKSPLGSTGPSLIGHKSRRPLLAKYHADIHISSSQPRSLQIFVKWSLFGQQRLTVTVPNV